MNKDKPKKNKMLESHIRVGIKNWHEKNMQFGYSRREIAVMMSEKYKRPISANQIVNILDERIAMPKRGVTPTRIKQTLKNKTTLQLLTGQRDVILAELDLNPDYTVPERLDALKVITQIEKKIQDLTLSQHLNAGDAELIFNCFKRLKADITHDEAMFLINEELKKLG